MSRLATWLAVIVLTMASAPVIANARPTRLNSRITAGFDKAVYGDFVLAGNTVTACPADQQDKPPRYPAARCRDGQDRTGTGAAAQNNGHFMVWSDVDKDKGTFDSSSAQVTIPAAAKVVFADLNWGGVGTTAPQAPCGKDAPAPPGSAAKQPVSLSAGGRPPVKIGPDRFKFAMDDPADLYSTDQAYYTAHADVTRELTGLTGTIPVTVGNVWTPQGFDCFGGWSLVVVWAFDSATAKAPARKNVTIYNGHIRVFGDGAPITLHTLPLRAAGGTTRIGVTAYEGDWASVGDAFKVNDKPQGDAPNNFFAASADGRVAPNKPNNMSIDARTIDVPDTVIKPGDPTAKLTFTGDADAYLVQSLAMSMPLPELTAVTTTDKPTVHEGDPVIQTITVSNAGAAPASDVMVYAGTRGRCRHQLGTLAAGKTTSVTCSAPANDDDYVLTARVMAKTLTGERMETKATTPVEVLRPVLVTSMTADPAIALASQPVTFEIRLRNAGDTALNAVTLKNTKATACDQGAPPTLKPTEAAVVRCTFTAGDEGLTNSVTATAKDTLGKEITVSTEASFEVARPKLTLSASWPPGPLVRGQLAHARITVTNESKIPLTDVKVLGKPSSCERIIGTLKPAETHTYECTVVIDADLTTELKAMGTPVINGQPVAGLESTVIGVFATKLVSKAAPLAPPEEPYNPPEVPKPPAAMGIATLAVLGMVLVFGAMAAGKKG